MKKLLSFPNSLIPITLSLALVLMASYVCAFSHDYTHHSVTAQHEQTETKYEESAKYEKCCTISTHGQTESLVLPAQKLVKAPSTTTHSFYFQLPLITTTQNYTVKSLNENFKLHPGRLVLRC